VASGWKVARLLWTYTQRLQLQTGTGLYHSCRNVRCVNPAHMRPGTGKGRKQDTRNRKYGDDHYSTTISDADVAEMKRLYADKMNPITQAELGKRFGVSQAQVSRILTGQRRRGTRSAF
jgi:CRP-like cAMP-binding protein